MLRFAKITVVVFLALASFAAIHSVASAALQSCSGFGATTCPGGQSCFQQGAGWSCQTPASCTSDLQCGTGYACESGGCACASTSCGAPVTPACSTNAGCTSSFGSGYTCSNPGTASAKCVATQGATNPSSGTSGSTSSGGACITIAPGATYNAAFYAQVSSACFTKFGAAYNACVASGQAAGSGSGCKYSDQSLAFNCGMPFAGNGVGYCLPSSPANSGCFPTMSAQQLATALAGVACYTGSGTTPSTPVTPTTPTTPVTTAPSTPTNSTGGGGSASISTGIEGSVLAYRQANPITASSSQPAVAPNQTSVSTTPPNANGNQYVAGTTVSNAAIPVIQSVLAPAVQILSALENVATNSSAIGGTAGQNVAAGVQDGITQISMIVGSLSAFTPTGVSNASGLLAATTQLSADLGSISSNASSAGGQAAATIASSVSSAISQVSQIVQNVSSGSPSGGLGLPAGPGLSLIASVQGYDSATNFYSKNVAMTGTTLLVNGTFDAASDTVSIDGTPVQASAESASQIAIPVASTAIGNHTVAVMTSQGASAPVAFQVVPYRGAPTAEITANGQHNLTIYNGEDFVLEWRSTNIGTTSVVTPVQGSSVISWNSANGDDTASSSIMIDGHPFVLNVDPYAFYADTPADTTSHTNVNLGLNADGYIVETPDMYGESYAFTRALSGKPYTGFCGLTADCLPDLSGGVPTTTIQNLVTGALTHLPSQHTYQITYVVKQGDLGRSASDTVTVTILPNGQGPYGGASGAQQVYYQQLGGSPSAGWQITSGPSGNSTVPSGSLMPGSSATLDWSGSANGAGYFAANGTKEYAPCPLPAGVGIDNVPAGIQASAQIVNGSSSVGYLVSSAGETCNFSIHFAVSVGQSVQPGVYLLHAWTRTIAGEKYYQDVPMEVFSPSASGPQTYTTLYNPYNFANLNPPTSTLLRYVQ